MLPRACPLHPLVSALAAMLLVLGAVACGGDPGDDSASIEKGLEERGTLELVEEIEKAEYTPPADGELSDEQIDMFLAVKSRERKIRQVAAGKLEERQKAQEAEGEESGFFEAISTMGDVADAVTAGPRAAVELGHNPKEYQWVQQKVFEVYSAERGQEVARALGEVSDSWLATLEEQRDQADDPKVRAELERQIEEMRAERQEMDVEGETSAGFEHNAQLVAEHRQAIEQALLEEDKALLGVEEAGEGG